MKGIKTSGEEEPQRHIGMGSMGLSFENETPNSLNKKDED
jgi:hypothetical protein